MWWTVAMDALQLGLEAQEVVALRMAKFARPGRFPTREAERMVREKIEMMTEVGTAASMLAIRGGDGPAILSDAIKRYRRRVHANAKRLSRARTKN